MTRWTKSIMKESGVSKIFKPHSSRSASTSAATNAGVTIDDVLKQGSWINLVSFINTIFKKWRTQEPLVRDYYCNILVVIFQLL